MNTLLHATNIKKEFVLGEVIVTALNDVSFDIYEGELITILGPSGSGKSTLLNIIGGIDTVTHGDLTYKDFKLHEANQNSLTLYRRQYIGFVFQFYNLMPNLTALENIEVVSEMTNTPIDAKVLIERVGLSDRAHYFPSKLSGGQQQRIAIARAICKNPDLLLCDEPTGALDIKTGAQVLQLLYDFNKEYKKTVIIITHNTDIAQIADRVFYFKDGRIDHIKVNEHPIPPNEVNW